MFDISLFRVFLAAIAGFLFGWLFFMPALFGDAWKRLHKFSKKELEQGTSPRVMGLGFIGTLVSSLALAVALSAWGVTAPSQAMIVALIIAIGFVATGNLTFVLWGKEPEGAFLINTLYLAMQFVLMAMILAW